MQFDHEQNNNDNLEFDNLNSEKINDQQQIRLKHLQELVDLGLNPYEITKVDRTCTLKQFHEKYEHYSHDELHEKGINFKETVAGKVMAIRQTFGVIQDFSSKLQFYINKKEFDVNQFHVFKSLLDIGDYVEIYGYPMKTMTGELTIKVLNFKIIAKSLRPLPEKFHGLVNEELKVRNRYIDLIMNEDARNKFVMRSKLISEIRKYMENLGYIEVETPILQESIGGASARPFITKHNTLNRNLYLRIATEIPLKKIIVGQFEKIFEIGRIFRNEGIDAVHNPEFTSMEAYCAYSDLNDMMNLCEGLFHNLAKMNNISTVSFRQHQIDLTKSFKKITMIDAIKHETNIDFSNLSDDEAIQIAKKHGIKMQEHEKTWGHIVSLFFEAFCEDKLVDPTFVLDHPLDITPLAKKKKDDPRLTHRFELFIGGKEFANAYSELNDPIDQKERFINQTKEKDLGNSEANENDKDFLKAMEYALPPTGGIGIGIDRLVMLFTQTDSIRQILFFPTNKEINKSN